MKVLQMRFHSKRKNDQHQRHHRGHMAKKPSKNPALLSPLFLAKNRGLSFWRFQPCWGFLLWGGCLKGGELSQTSTQTRPTSKQRLPTSFLTPQLSSCLADVHILFTKRQVCNAYGCLRPQKHTLHLLVQSPMVRIGSYLFVILRPHAEM